MVTVRILRPVEKISISLFYPKLSSEFYRIYFCDCERVKITSVLSFSVS